MDTQGNVGKVINQNGEKIAVYKDEKGNLTTLSAVCTHKHCIVKWNQTGKSWDCPCHGSRFDPKGKVVQGPAVTDLPQK